ncbi:hypothetical protein PInf_004342 [Phytophthora infestans]|nr:hypothetical protein PInf_004342 [Phytophthora infestans]
MTKPRGGVPRDIEDTGRDLSLKSVWRELRQEGWTRKSPPRSCLNDRYRYILTDAISHVADKVFEIEDDDLASGSEEVDDEDSAEVSTGGEDIKDDLDLLGSELLADKHDDLNVVESG